MTKVSLGYKMIDYQYQHDIEQVRHLRNLSVADIARGCQLSEKTIWRWLNGESVPDRASLETFYDYAYEQRVRLNKIKAQFHQETYGKASRLVLFHGSRSLIDGDLSLDKCKPNSDFGRGFYCGESLEQSAMFVSGIADSSLYIAGFDPRGLKCATYEVDQDWMLTIAAFRGRLGQYADHPRIVALRNRLRNVDYVVAPIADNRMYEQITEFLDGLITDVVCEHCLSATQLGKQYVMISQRALDRVELLERCFLSSGEKRFYSQSRADEVREAEDKVKAAKRQFRGQGSYIDELIS